MTEDFTIRSAAPGADANEPTPDSSSPVTREYIDAIVGFTESGDNTPNTTKTPKSGNKTPISATHTHAVRTTRESPHGEKYFVMTMTGRDSKGVVTNVFATIAAFAGSFSYSIDHDRFDGFTSTRNTTGGGDIPAVLQEDKDRLIAVGNAVRRETTPSPADINVVRRKVPRGGSR